jgi:hypothetical protein
MNSNAIFNSKQVSSDMMKKSRPLLLISKIYELVTVVSAK